MRYKIKIGPRIVGLFLLALALAGCQKAKSTPTVGDSASDVMLSSFQIPVPDGSYSTRSGGAAVTLNADPHSSIQFLMTYIDAIAVPLKESNMHLDQVIAEGHVEGSVLNITHSGLSAQLTGVRDDNAGKINWTYTKSGTVYFSGNTSQSGDTGKFDFTTQPIHLEWSFTGLSGNVTKTLTLRNGTSTGFLDFRIKFGAGGAQSVELLPSSFARGETITGKWDASGGEFQAGTKPKVCWGPAPGLGDITCPAAN